LFFREGAVKSIQIRCSCGSSIEFTDAAESYITPDGKADSKGRRYLVEVRADEYLTRHQKCVDVKNQLLVQAATSAAAKKVP
jgi:hypothetical protein